MNLKSLAGAVMALSVFALPTLAADDPPGDKGDRLAHHKVHCNKVYAMHSGRMAFLEARLELTAQQKPLFDAWQKSVLAQAQSAKTTCLADQPKEGAKPTILERQARMEQRLSDGAKALKATRPSLEALYAALTPDQKKILDHGGGHGMNPHGMGGHGMGVQGTGHHRMGDGPKPDKP